MKSREPKDFPSVLLRVDEKIRQQRLIDVLNALAAVGIVDVAFDDFVSL